MSAVITAPHAPLEQMSDEDLRRWDAHCFREATLANMEKLQAEQRLLLAKEEERRATSEYRQWGAEMRATEIERARRGLA